MIVDKNTKIYIGDTHIISVYQGDNQIYQPYTELEYLSVNGDVNFMIPVGYTDDLRLKFKIYFGNVTGKNANILEPWGGTWDGNLYIWSFWSTLYAHYNRNQIIGYSYSDLNQHRELILESMKSGSSQVFQLKDFNENILTSNSRQSVNLDFSSNKYITLCGEPAWGTPTALIGKVYYFEIYDANDTLIHNYVPVTKDDIVCLYDKIDGTYVYAANGTPTAGPIKQ